MHRHPKTLIKPFLFICLLNAVSAYPQSIILKGKILDRDSQEPIPFVHVLDIQSNASTVADLRGEFSLAIPETSNSIQFSCMGYRPISLTGVPTRPFLSVQMEQDIIELEAVQVLPEDPIQLLIESVNRVTENHGSDSTLLQGYYLMNSTLGGKTLRYTEAILEILKPPYFLHDLEKNPLGDSVIVKEVRQKDSEINDWKIMAMTPWEQSVYLLQNRDVARDFTSVPNQEGFRDNYEFEIDNRVLIEGRSTYKIKIIPKKNRKDAYWNGYIYLDEETKALVKIDFISNEKLLRKMKASLGYQLMSNLYKFHYAEGEWREVIQYKLKDGYWYLDEINAEKNFLASSKKRNLKDEPLNVQLQYKTTSFSKNPILGDVSFLPHDVGKASLVFEENFRPEFWIAFDGQRGVITDTKSFEFKSKQSELTPYQFSRLDTLKGSLTPLRTSYDVGFYHLDVEVFPEEEIIQGSSLIRFEVVEPTEKIQIDLYSGMGIDSIVHRSKPVPFEREYDAVYVSFSEGLKKGDIEEITVYFGGRPLDFDPAIPMYASFLWIKDQEDRPWIQAICQGYGASGWWPNKDHLSDEPDSVAITITNPSDLVAVSNGRMVDKKQFENGKTQTTWQVSYPINNYNITLNIGHYESISKVFPSQEGELDVEYHVMDYHLDNVPSKFEITEKALETFEKYFGPYPFPKDGIKLMETPHAMEHQSAVALGIGYFRNEDTGIREETKPDFASGLLPDQILLHEFAHEWWGNSVSCTDNAELWIHEAFATYAEALFIEEQYGYEEALTYLNAMKPSISNKQPVIGHFGVNHVHYNIWDMYVKGALFLNTLRHVIDDDKLWFEIIKDVQRDFKHQSITTDQVLAYFNQKTVIELRPIFDQYLRLTEIPELELKMESNTAGNVLIYRWKANAEGFAMPISYEIGTGEKLWIFPENDWQKLNFGTVQISDVNFHTQKFYVTILTP